MNNYDYDLFLQYYKIVTTLIDSDLISVKPLNDSLDFIYSDKKFRMLNITPLINKGLKNLIKKI
jgi:hypothetical protein